MSAPSTMAEPARRARVRKPWSFAIGEHGARVVAEERLDRGGQVTIRFGDPTRRTRDTRCRKQLKIRLRDAEGRVRPDLELIVKEAARRQHIKILNERQIRRTDVIANFMSLAEALAIAVPPFGRGVFLGAPRHRKDAERYAKRLVEIIGSDRRVDSIRPKDITDAIGAWAQGRADGLERGLTFGAKRSHARTSDIADLDTALRRHSQASTGRESEEQALVLDAVGDDAALMPGERCLELALSTLEKAIDWLEANGYLVQTSFRMPPKWRQQMHRTWREFMPTDDDEDTMARHTASEVAALFGELRNCDVRFQLLFDLAAELRLGQVLWVNRSNLDLNGDAENPFGTLRIPRRGKKRGCKLSLTSHQRKLLGYALTHGLLRDYESAFVAGRIDDYPLFPGGKLRRGVARVRRSLVRWNRRSALDEFHALEARAGVASIVGRGWYGVRRKFADIAPKLTSDDLVLLQLGAHSTETRNRNYRDAGDPELIARVRELKERMRSDLIASAQ